MNPIEGMVCTDQSMAWLALTWTVTGINIAVIVGQTLRLLAHMRFHKRAMREHEEALDRMRACMRSDLDVMRDQARRLEVARHNAVEVGLNPNEVLQ